MLLLLLAFALLILFGTWFNLRSAWGSVDRAAEDFVVPEGFDELGTHREGYRICMLMCPNDEVTTTRLMIAPESQAVACDRLREAVERQVSNLASGSRGRCEYFGAVEGGVEVAGIVASRSLDFEPLGPARIYDYRWTRGTPIPDAPLIAWVEYTAPI